MDRQHRVGPRRLQRVSRRRPRRGRPSTLVGAGDIASCSSTGDEATALLLDGIPGTVFTHRRQRLRQRHGRRVHQLLRPDLGPRTRRARGPSPATTSTARPAPPATSTTSAPPPATRPRATTATTSATWHVIVLNSNCCAVVSCAAGSAQEQWLRADLAASDADVHASRSGTTRASARAATTATTPETQPLWQALYDFNADLILTGHDHTYERFAPADGHGRRRPDPRHPPVRRRHRRPQPLRLRHDPAQQRGPQRRHLRRPQARPSEPTGYDWEFVPDAGRPSPTPASDVCHDANGPLTGSGTPLNGATPLSEPVVRRHDRRQRRPTYDYVVTAVDDADQESLASGVRRPPPRPRPTNAGSRLRRQQRPRHASARPPPSTATPSRSRPGSAATAPACRPSPAAAPVA